MRLLVTGGGTGGHVYPALSVLEAFDPAPESLLWVGKRGGMEAPLVARAGIPYRAIAAGGLADMAWSARLRNSALLLRGFGEAWGVVQRFAPDVVFATGGYVTFPVGLAAWLQRRPIAVYLPDIKPGLAVRSLAPLASRVAVTVAQSATHFGAKAVVTGYPVRQALLAPKSRDAARQRLGVPADAKLLLVTGGSQGAHSLNEAVGINLESLLEMGHLLHVHGKVDGEWLAGLRAALPDELRRRYHLHDYLHETMGDALIGADLVLARAGASVLGEFTVAGLPAILVPLPISGVQQEDNARWVEAQGGAVVIEDGRIRAQLAECVAALLSDEARLHAMRRAMQGAAHPDAAAKIVAVLHALASRRHETTPHKARTRP